MGRDHPPPSTDFNAPEASTDGTLRTALEKLSEVERHRLLASKHRQVVLSNITATAPSLTLEQLTHAIVSSETEKVTADAPRALMVSLHHTHLPMLDEFGLIDYDHEHDQITITSGRNPNVGR